MSEAEDRLWKALSIQSERMDKFERAMEENTGMTRDIRDLMLTARTGFKVLGWVGTGARWVGGIAAAIAAVYSLIYIIMHGGQPPGK